MPSFDRTFPFRAVATLALLTLAGPSRAQAGKASAGSPVLHELNAAVSHLVAKVSPAVVQIRVTGYGPAGEPLGVEGQLVSRQRTIGSGVIVDPSGYVLTDYPMTRAGPRSTGASGSTTRGWWEPRPASTWRCCASRPPASPPWPSIRLPR
jgi:hypothetical protein